MRFAMPEISGRRSDQLGDFMAVLELRAIDLDHRAAIPGQCLRGGFHQSRFARSSRSQEQKIANRPARADHTRQVGLINVDNLLDRFVLTNDLALQAGFQVLRLTARERRIQYFVEPYHG